ncbi:hypothetical protein COMA2_290006 [Candidatus Nitrospira nitrificans]|uniref:Uncharacterized protein n=1 Tax=Candidatus Nitrospira nitrificans TaxID=1742973 RepID=A0A0S4LH54_9BACT|nr:hypothetical protein COMA2_290006 [Candidatus Nitrospira nitrificans]
MSDESTHSGACRLRVRQLPDEPVAGFAQVGVLRLFCENCVVQGMLGRKVLVERRFIGARGLGNSLRDRSGKAVCGKQRCRRAEQACRSWLEVGDA